MLTNPVDSLWGLFSGQSGVKTLIQELWGWEILGGGQQQVVRPICRSCSEIRSPGPPQVVSASGDINYRKAPNFPLSL